MAARLSRIDWRALIEQMLSTGISLLALSKRLQIADSTLDRYRAGSEPPHCVGEQLIEAWCTMRKASRTQLPLLHQQ